MQQLGLEPGRFIALHVRRGDKSHGEGRAIPLRAYFERAELARRSSAVRGCCDVVYVAHDDESLATEIRDEAERRGFRLVRDENETAAGLRRGASLPTRAAGAVTASEEGVAEMMNCFKNMFIFAEAYTLVGADMSTYFRYARALRGLDGSEWVAGHSLLHNLLVGEWEPL